MRHKIVIILMLNSINGDMCVENDVENDVEIHTQHPDMTYDDK